MIKIQNIEQLEEAIELLQKHKDLREDTCAFIEKLGFISYSHDAERTLSNLIREFKPTGVANAKE